MFEKKMRLGWIGSAALGLTLIACGDSESGLVNEDFPGEPIAKISGEMSATDTSNLNGEVSLALVWYNENFRVNIVPYPPAPDDFSCNGEPNPERTVDEVVWETPDRWFTQATTFEGSFPLRFEMPLYDLPPTDAMLDIDEAFGTGKLAFARFLVFVDSNGNGVFDPPSPYQTIDRVLALDYSMAVIYLDGTLNPDPETGEASPIPQGFSIEVVSLDDAGQSVAQYFAPEEGVGLAIPADEAERRFAERWTCTSLAVRNEYGGAIPDGFELDELLCDQSGRDYSQYNLSRIDALDASCILRRHIRQACITPNAPLPADWPCE